MYVSGQSCLKVGRALSISETTVYRILVRHGVPLERRDPRGNKRKFDTETERRMSALYSSGVRTSAIAEQFGCSVDTVRGLVKRNGVRVLRGNRIREFSPADVAEMATRWLAGESQTAIGRAMGVSQSIVSRVLRSAGHEKEHRKPVGPNHGSWRGGRVRLQGGYVGIRLAIDDDLYGMGQNKAYVLEHRLVMARSLGRALLPTETVHHINGIRDDNRIENLQLRQGVHGAGAAFVCCDCGSTNVRSTKLKTA